VGAGAINSHLLDVEDLLDAAGQTYKTGKLASIPNHYYGGE